MNRIPLALPLLALGTTGCLEAAVALTVADALDGPNRYDDSYGDDSYGDDSYGDDSYGDYTTYTVLEGEMLGTMPISGELDRPVTDGTLSRVGSWLDLDIHATSSDWAMIVGSIDTSRLEPGVPTELSLSEFSLTGCGGSVRGQADYYDVPADSVVVTEQVVEIDGEQLLEYRFIGTFGGEGSTDTTVVVPMPDED